MDTLVENGILLNLSTGNTNNRRKKPSKSKQPVVKATKRQASGDSGDSQKVTAHEISDHKKKRFQGNEVVKYDGRHVDRRKVASSLFRSNPEIPHVPVLPVDQVSEEVFTKEEFSSIPHLHPHLLSVLRDDMKVECMTRVQRLTIPRVMEGSDCLVKSQTGSGKTLAYAVPIVNKLRDVMPKIQRSDGPYAVVLVPTRELAIQSLQEFQKLTKSCVWIVCGSLMGGEKKKAEKARLRKGINILVSTPGRLVDHIRHTHSLNLSHVNTLVLDEADRLLELGFERDLAEILDALSGRSDNSQAAHNNRRQTLLLSATLTESVERLASLSLREPQFIDSAVTEGSSRINEALTQSDVSSRVKGDEPPSGTTYSLPANLRQYFIIVPSKLRLVTLTSFILKNMRQSSGSGSKIMIFLSTQHSVDFHHRLLDGVLNDVDLLEQTGERHIRLLKLHGNMTQKERTSIYFEFRDVEQGVLLCTDVASRGLDISGIQWIVQYNAAGAPTDYIHRIGRTARLTSHGTALIFLTPCEAHYCHLLQTHYHIQLEAMDLDKLLSALRSHMSAAESSNKGRSKKGVVGNKTTQECATELQNTFEEFVMENSECRMMARKAFTSYVRSYATFPKVVKQIFRFKNLHLGHVAKSFALREAPSKVADIVRVVERRAGAGRGNKRNSSSGGSKVDRPAGSTPRVVSEFSSGLLDFRTQALDLRRHRDNHVDVNATRSTRDERGERNAQHRAARVKHRAHGGGKSHTLTEDELKRFD